MGLTPLDPNKLKLKLTIDSKFKETVHANKEVTTTTVKQPTRLGAVLGTTNPGTAAAASAVAISSPTTVNNENSFYLDSRPRNTEPKQPPQCTVPQQQQQQHPKLVSIAAVAAQAQAQLAAASA